MMLRVLGSGSSGNTYLINSDTECLVLESGIPLKEVKKSLDYNISKIVGVVCSHQHGDHFSHAEEYLKSGIPVYASEETHKSLAKEYDNQIIVRPGYWYKPDKSRFEIIPFPLEHDVECYGYIIKHPDMGTLIFATDTSFVKSTFNKLKPSHLLIECNYSEDIVERNLLNGSLDQERVDRTIRTHMELATCKKFVEANKNPMLDNLVLLHLSDGNGDPNRFRNELQEVVGDDVRVWVADKGLEVKLDLFPW